MTTAVEKAAYSPEQVSLIKRTVCVGGSDDELALFLRVCQRSGLDPFARQIYAIKRKGKMTIQVGIDGYRLIADRTGSYAGNDDPVFDSEENPRKATVTVYKLVGGLRCPFTATARWAQYFPGDDQGFMWKRMPHLMLGKVAEALALRKAFPAELSGMYTREEMEQAGAAEAEPARELVEAKPEPTASEKERVEMFALLTRKGKSWEMCTDWLNSHFKTESPYVARTKLTEIHEIQRAALAAALESMADAAAPQKAG